MRKCLLFICVTYEIAANLYKKVNKNYFKLNVITYIFFCTLHEVLFANLPASTTSCDIILLALEGLLPESVCELAYLYFSRTY